MMYWFCCFRFQFFSSSFSQVTTKKNSPLYLLLLEGGHPHKYTYERHDKKSFIPRVGTWRVDWAYIFGHD